ncbi:DNA polymerase III subunit delta [Proteinivorax tanatarense]|uniref:DNA polymerase III subunit delta n=1 Tax=Proteinivorax tanatarense TaxID=1260629 RepID=A0AAU7VIU2_9FIRM
MDKILKLKNNQLSNLYLLYGNERYWIEKNLNNIFKTVFAKDDEMKDYNYDLIGSDFTLNRVEEVLQGLPFMSDKRLVVLKNTGLFKKNGSKKEKELENLLIEYLNNPNPQIVLVVAEVECHNVKSRKIYKLIHKEGTILHCNSLKPYEIRQWIKEQFENHNIKVTGGIINTLAASLDNNLYTLENEINKIVAYLGDKETLTIEDVNAVCAFANNDNIFELIDKISEGKSSDAIKVLHKMNKNGTHYLLIYSMIVNHFRLLTKVLDFTQRGYTSKNINNKLKLHPFRLEKAIKQTSLFTLKNLHKKLSILAKYEGKIKQGKIEGVQGLEMAIVEMNCQ